MRPAAAEAIDAPIFEREDGPRNPDDILATDIPEWRPHFPVQGEETVRADIEAVRLEGEDAREPGQPAGQHRRRPLSRTLPCRRPFLV